MKPVALIAVAFLMSVGSRCEPATTQSAARTWTRCQTRDAATWHDLPFRTMLVDHQPEVTYVCSGVVRIDGADSPSPSLLDTFERQSALSNALMEKILLEFRHPRNPRSICRAWNDDLYKRLAGTNEVGVILQSAQIVWPSGDVDLTRLNEPETFPRPGQRAWLPPGFPPIVCEP